ncbi:hypothetical protein POSPLADRAFT_1056805 [Postia placenta MAD-698-R-SB12]|uniref:Uncharacterized protein n=1 Tax=Postia placenta MAD-698-R-SB12 TaxID=670580 RepID=A0A1X6N0R5_9APHY|nr:hypothetical protein POSPLADRAFT_1056805 [Postia placenta MAD-698-R-SB12]OSX62221.1 hypothetical protein POSPLADRAFT_1056805 [Postia placenta MAD-698-R-SB12]
MRERAERRGLTLTATAREKGKGTGKYNSGNGSARRRKRKTRCGPCLPPCDFTLSATPINPRTPGSSLLLASPISLLRVPPPSCAFPWHTAACGSGHALRTVHTRTQTRRHRLLLRFPSSRARLPTHSQRSAVLDPRAQPRNGNTSPRPLSQRDASRKLARNARRRLASRTPSSSPSARSWYASCRLATPLLRHRSLAFQTTTVNVAITYSPNPSISHPNAVHPPSKRGRSAPNHHPARPHQSTGLYRPRPPPRDKQKCPLLNPDVTPSPAVPVTEPAPRLGVPTSSQTRASASCNIR